MLLNVLATIATVVVVLTISVALGTVALSDKYEIAHLSINEHEGFMERA